MKRFLKTFVLLIISLFVLVSGVDAALDHLSHVPTQSTFIVYNEKGVAVLAYSGDVTNGKSCIKPSAVIAPGLTHRS